MECGRLFGSNALWCLLDGLATYFSPCFILAGNDCVGKSQPIPTDLYILDIWYYFLSLCYYCYCTFIVCMC